ncbi:hypothetical protein LCGC14_1226860 [marine sediment metagenome]|uniref:Uncharacterized protein n=1 Tax=marine sediment metagenome TaxID=412755 RepID=A0A0F9L9N4_9ZZZZ
MSCDILENPTVEQVDENLEKSDASIILHSIDKNEIHKIIKYYSTNKDFDIVYIHKYTEGEKETIFGMKRLNLKCLKKN